MDNTKKYPLIKLLVSLLSLFLLISAVSKSRFFAGEYAVSVQYREEVCILRSVNLNTADSGELQRLHRVGPIIAQRIIAYREANGKFGSVEEIQNVRGIGPNIFEQNRHLLTVG